MTTADDTLIRAVIARDRALARRVRLRDILELVVAAGMAGAFLWVATRVPVAWPWWLAAAITAGVGAVFVRERARRPQGATGGQLHTGVRQALAEVDHQIRLLRSVVWWYLAPLALVAALIILGAILSAAHDLTDAQWQAVRGGLVGAVVAVSAAIVPVYALVWWVNQRAVQQHLLPHRQQLVEVLRQLEGDGTMGEA